MKIDTSQKCPEIWGVRIFLTIFSSIQPYPLSQIFVLLTEVVYPATFRKTLRRSTTVCRIQREKVVKLLLEYW